MPPRAAVATNDGGQCPTGAFLQEKLKGLGRAFPACGAASASARCTNTTISAASDIATGRIALGSFRTLLFIAAMLEVVAQRDNAFPFAANPRVFLPAFAKP